MSRKPEQEALPGIPGPPKRKIIAEIEELSLDIDKDSGKRTALSDRIAVKKEKRQEMLVTHKLDIYTYENADGILQDVMLEMTSRKRKSKLNPKKSKADE